MVSAGASFLGVIGAVRQAVRLPPAEAMRPEPPAEFKRRCLSGSAWRISCRQHSAWHCEISSASRGRHSSRAGSGTRHRHSHRARRDARRNRLPDGVPVASGPAAGCHASLIEPGSAGAKRHAPSARSDERRAFPQRRRPALARHRRRLAYRHCPRRAAQPRARLNSGQPVALPPSDFCSPRSSRRSSAQARRPSASKFRRASGP